MSTHTSGGDVPIRRIDRILAVMALGLTIVSIILFFVLIIATASGMHQQDFATGLWPVVGVFPIIALPIAFLMILALLIMSFVRRARANKGV